MPLTSDKDRAKEVATGTEVDKDNFYRKILIVGLAIIIPVLSCVILYVILKGG